MLCGIYGLLAVTALLTTWYHNVAFFQEAGHGGLLGFIQAGYANHASASLTNDLVVAATAAFVFMVVEARRLGMKRVWVYLALSIVIAFSVALPLFLIARQLKLAERRVLKDSSTQP